MHWCGPIPASVSLVTIRKGVHKFMLVYGSIIGCRDNVEQVRFAITIVADCFAIVADCFAIR